MRLSPGYLLAEWDLDLRPCECGQPVFIREYGRLIYCDACGNAYLPAVGATLEVLVKEWNRRSTGIQH